jgi:6-phosphogluconolactonase (cycloisomerase 2 family)
MKPANQALAIAVALLTSLSLAGCFGKGGFQISPPGCGNNCPPSPEFLYATSTDHISAFTINQSTGALSAPLTMAGPNQSLGMVATVTLGHLYVSDFLNDAVDGFSINSTSGGLTPITGSPFPLGGTPPGAGGLSAIVSAGTYVYATELNAGTVAGFAFDSTSGKLTPVPGSPFPAGNTPVQAAQAGSQGKFLALSIHRNGAQIVRASQPMGWNRNVYARYRMGNCAWPTGTLGTATQTRVSSLVVPT